MDTYSCPKGHQSTEPDFCSECGAKIAVATANEPAVVAGAVCPDCQAPRLSRDSVFCEVCGYNFSTGAHGEIPMPAVTAPPNPDPPPEPPEPPAPPIEATPAHPDAWNVIVTVDPAPRESGSPQPPADVGPFTFALTKSVNLIGRRSAARAIDPEIPLDFDDAVSHRHAVLTRSGDGGLVVRDVGSSNGIELNGAVVPPMTDQALHEGDQLTLGHWTRIAIERTSGKLA